MAKDHAAKGRERAAKAQSKADRRAAHAPKKAAAKAQRGWQTKDEQRMTGGIGHDLRAL